MKKWEKLAYLKETYFGLFVKTREKVEEELSYEQQLICCCGSLATGIHESHCTKFQNKVDAETIKRLQHLLPKQKDTALQHHG